MARLWIRRERRMVKTKVFERGDIVSVSLEPSKGREQKGEKRPALVLSPHAFNELGVTLVAPITQGGNFARFAGFTVSLMGSGTKTQGVILVNQIRTLDLIERQAEKHEVAPAFIVDEVLAKLLTIIQ